MSTPTTSVKTRKLQRRQAVENRKDRHADQRLRRIINALNRAKQGLMLIKLRNPQLFVTCKLGEFMKEIEQ